MLATKSSSVCGGRLLSAVTQIFCNLVAVLQKICVTDLVHVLLQLCIHRGVHVTLLKDSLLPSLTDPSSSMSMLSTPEPSMMLRMFLPPLPITMFTFSASTCDDEFNTN